MRFASAMLAVDTNVLVRLIVRDDANQVSAAEEFIAKGAWVSHLVLIETMWVLDALYDRTGQQIALAVEMLLNHKELAIQDSDVVAMAVDEYRNRPALGFSDCLVLQVARKAGYLPLGTFDRELAKLDEVQRL
jgi:predicted nucleic-acid-binding protein